MTFDQKEAAVNLLVFALAIWLAQTHIFKRIYHVISKLLYILLWGSSKIPCGDITICTLAHCARGLKIYSLVRQTFTKLEVWSQPL